MADERVGKTTEDEMISEIKFTNLARVLTNYAIEVRNNYQDALVRSDRIASGKLLNSVEYITEFNGNEYQVFLQLEDYWKFVEAGVNGTERSQGSPFSFKSKRVNVSAILDWIRVKPILPRPKNGKLPTPQSLAYALATNIAKFGIEGSHDLEETLEQVNARYEKEIMDAIDADLAFAIDAELQFLVKPFSEHNQYV